MVGASQPGKYRLFGASAALIGVILVGIPGLAAGIKPPADPATALVVGTPYTLAPATTQVEQGFSSLAQGKTGYAVKMVHDASGSSIGIMLSISGADDGGSFWAQFDKGAQTNAGVTSTPTQFNGSEARLLAGSGVVGIAYVANDGLMVVVYAKDEATARSIAQSQVQASAPAK